jgi:hypothetical protein
MDFELESCIATIGGQRLKQSAKSMEDPNDWETIERMVEKYMREGIKGIRIDYVVSQAKKRRDPAFAPVAVENDGDSDDEDEESPKPKKRKVCSLKMYLIIDTNRYTYPRNRDRILERGPSGVREIYKEWKCTAASRINSTFYCFVDESDGKHYKLDATDVSQWAKAINLKAGNATLKRPSERLRAKLMRRTRLSKQQPNTPNTSSTSQGGNQTNVTITLPDFIGMSGRRLFNAGSSPPGPTPTHPRQVIQVRNSSPILSDDEPDTELDRYFTYLSQKYKRDAEKFNRAKVALANEDLDLRGIKIFVAFMKQMPMFWFDMV